MVQRGGYESCSDWTGPNCLLLESELWLAFVHRAFNIFLAPSDGFDEQIDPTKYKNIGYYRNHQFTEAFTPSPNTLILCH